jgi:hypothetical protein
MDLAGSHSGLAPAVSSDNSDRKVTAADSQHQHLHHSQADCQRLHYSAMYNNKPHQLWRLVTLRNPR